MSINANWHISGVNFDKSAEAFIKSAQVATDDKTLKKHESYLNKQFKQHIIDNIYRAGIEGEGFEDAFHLSISGSNVQFINNSPLITHRYEYGYYQKDDDYDEYDDVIVQTSPRYFIRPSIKETLIDIGNIALNEAKRSYINDIQTARKDEIL